MMRVKSKAPQIRFKGFSGEWNQHKLGELLVITSASRVHKNEWRESGVRFFRSSDVVADYKGLSNNKAFISFDLYKELSNKSGYVQKNDLLVTGGGSIGIPYLVKNNEPLYFKDADLLWLKNSNDINGNFLYTFFSTPTFRSYVSSITHIGTISHYTIEQAKSTPINLPVKKEQDIIGDYFQNLDKLIEQKEQKYQKLRQFKTAMLSKMFPQNGATTPEIRFKGFSGEWEEKEISDLFLVTRGNVLAATETSDKQSESMPYPVYSSQTKNNGLLGYYKKYLFENAITWTTDGANAGTVKYREGKFYSTNVNGVLLSNEGYANQAIAEILNRIAWKHVSYVGNPKLMNNVMSKIKIRIPKSIDEQKHLSLLLSNIDKLTYLHQQEIEKLRHIKKASLEKMFV